MNVATVTPWTGEGAPDEAGLLALMQAEGLRPYHWANAPFDAYEAHAHSYHKVIYVVSGAIIFGLPVEGRHILMRAGDRLDLPPFVIHDAAVGPDGVACLEAQR